MKHAPVFAAAFMLAASASFTITVSATAQVREPSRDPASATDRQDDSGALRDLLKDPEALRDAIMKKFERRAALRGLLTDRLERYSDLQGDEDWSGPGMDQSGRQGSREYFERDDEEEPMIDREDVRDIILDQIQSGGLNRVLDQLRDRVSERQ